MRNTGHKHTYKYAHVYTQTITADDPLPFTHACMHACTCACAYTHTHTLLETLYRLWGRRHSCRWPWVRWARRRRKQYPQGHTPWRCSCSPRRWHSRHQSPCTSHRWRALGHDQPSGLSLQNHPRVREREYVDSSMEVNYMGLWQIPAWKWTTLEWRNGTWSVDVQMPAWKWTTPEWGYGSVDIQVPPSPSLPPPPPTWKWTTLEWRNGNVMPAWKQPS